MFRFDDEELSQKATLSHYEPMSRSRPRTASISPNSIPPLPKRTWVEINHAALRHNLKVVCKLAAPSKIMAVVKANGYGHGLNEVASTLRDGIETFAVASLGEAVQLRNTERKKPILLLSAALPAEYEEIARQGFIPTISSLHEATLFAKAASSRNIPDAGVHFKIDTGMGRLGALPSEAARILRGIIKLPLRLHSISTHLPSADSDAEFTSAQLKTFQKLVAELQTIAPGIPVHVLNSAATILMPSHAYDLVRIGLLLYGVSPIPSSQKLVRPVLSWKASVTYIRKIPKGQGISYGSTYRASKDLTVAVLPVGYADGYPRQISGKGATVLIKGQRCPVLGRVTMDQVMVDISLIAGVKVGDQAVLVGSQKGQEITASEVAAWADTIPWHLFCGITERVAYWHKHAKETEEKPVKS